MVAYRGAGGPGEYPWQARTGAKLGGNERSEISESSQLAPGGGPDWDEAAWCGEGTELGRSGLVWGGDWTGTGVRVGAEVL